MALGAIIARAGEFQPLNIALISWGLAKLAYRAEVAFEALCDSAVKQWLGWTIASRHVYTHKTLI